MTAETEVPAVQLMVVGSVTSDGKVKSSLSVLYSGIGEDTVIL